MFAEFFMQILQKRHIKPYHVAKETGISAGLMSDYANGKKQPTLNNIVKIADALNITVDELLGRDNKAYEDFMSNLSKEDIAMIEEYTELSEDDRRMVADIINLFAERKRKK